MSSEAYIITLLNKYVISIIFTYQGSVSCKHSSHSLVDSQVTAYYQGRSEDNSEPKEILPRSAFLHPLGKLYQRDLHNYEA